MYISYIKSDTVVYLEITEIKPSPQPYSGWLRNPAPGGN